MEVAYRLSGRKWQRDAQSDVKYFLSAEATGFQVVKKGGERGAADASAGDPNARFAEAAEDDEVPF